MYDLVQNTSYKAEFINKDLRATIMDSEGYYYQGDYVVPLGAISSASAFVTVMAGTGISVKEATAMAKLVYDFSTSLFEIRGSQWYKTDEIYDYSKRIEYAYELISGNTDSKLGGPFTYRTKKKI